MTFLASLQHAPALTPENLHKLLQLLFLSVASKELGNNSKLNVLQLKEILAQGGLEVDILDAAGRPVHGKTLVANLDDRFVFRANIEVDQTPTTSRDQPDQPSLEVQPTLTPPLPHDACAERLIRQIDEQQKTRSFVWIGYLLNEFLPGLGLRPDEAKALVKKLELDSVLFTTKRPNPNNPDRPATVVSLNRHHPDVIRILGAVASPRRFQPIGVVRGEPISDTIIRDRR